MRIPSGELNVSGYMFRWRVHEVAVSKGIRNVLSLHNMLEKQGKNVVSYPQLTKILKKPPSRISLPLLVALSSALGCNVVDLFVLEKIRRN